MEFGDQTAMLKKVQEIEFVAVELNLYLDTHPCDETAVNDYNCAVETLKQLKREYETCYGPLLNFGWGGYSRAPGIGPWDRGHGKYNMKREQ